MDGASSAGRPALSVGRILPQGGSLPPEEWGRRHRALLGLLWLSALILPLYGAVTQSYDALHTLAHGAGLVTLAVAASTRRLSRVLRSACVSLGYLTAAAVLVHLTDGLIEAHFLFFVAIVALTLYEDWVPFLLAVTYVLIHHGVLGTLVPQEVYNRPEAWAEPWRWAGIHAFFVALAGAAGIGAWRLNESVRERMQATQRELARLSETDSLTGLPNRRKAMDDLSAAFRREGPETNMLALFDLDGFKTYNDSFGHPAGDQLLVRLGRQLESRVGGRMRAYRLGGDEFCVIGEVAAGDLATAESAAAAALSEHGQAFSISASYGSVAIPAEAKTPEDAMRLADQRMYARKNSSRPTAIDQSKNVLLQALAERHPDLGDHLDNVAELAEPVAKAVGMPADALPTLRYASELHDVGKMAIPDAILSKPGPLDEAEWEFVRRHTVIGQRIVAAAPALARAGEMIRASHERWDGGGYPDGLAGEEIPLGARVIAVCDAFDAMVSERPYKRALSEQDALAELRRCAGHQFDPAVVHAFEQVVAQPGARRRRTSAEKLLDREGALARRRGDADGLADPAVAQRLSDGRLGGEAPLRQI